MDQLPPAPRAVTRWSARLVDARQEHRYLEARRAVLRRDALVAATAVALYNAWSVVEAFTTTTTPAQGLLEAANNAVILLGAGVVALHQVRAGSWSATARGAVVAIVCYTLASVSGTLVADTTPRVALVVTLVSAAVVYLHAQLPVLWTAALGAGFSAAGFSALAWSAEHRRSDFPSSEQVHWDFLVEASLLLLVLNVIGVLSTYRGATNERLLFAEREATHHLARTDPLTGLANRRHWEDHAQEAWQRCALRGAPVGLVLVDVDGFKGVNDRYGHAGGDAVLRRLAALLASSTRHDGALAARLGGDEFAVVLPGVDVPGAQDVAASLLAGVRAVRAASAPDDPCSRLAISLGATSATTTPAVTAGSSGWEQLVTAADALLYAAKAGGRDQVAAGASAG